MATFRDEYIIEQFSLEEKHYKELSNLITDTFLADPAAQLEGASVIFNEEIFRTFFGSPSVDRELFVRTKIKATGEIIGFLGLIPRKLKIKDKIYKFAVPSWLSVHPKHQRKGIGSAMGYHMLESLKARGYDGAFGIFEPEQHGLDTYKSVVRKVNISIKRLVTIKQFVIRVFDAEAAASVVKVKWIEKLVFKLLQKIKPVNNPQIRFYKPTDFEQIYALIEDLVDRHQMSIIPQADDVKWLLNRPNLICVVHEDDSGKIDGFVSSWEFIVAGFGNQAPFGWLETVHTYKMHKKDVKDLANYLCMEAHKRGWAGIQTPFIPYFDPKPFKKAKFIFFGKKMTLDIGSFEDISIPDKVDSFYFDWR